MIDFNQYQNVKIINVTFCEEFFLNINDNVLLIVSVIYHKF